MTTARDVIAKWFYQAEWGDRDVCDRAAESLMCHLGGGFVPDSVRMELAAKLNPWRTADSAPKDGNDFQALLFDGMQMVVFYDKPNADSPNHCWHRADGLAYHKDALKAWAPLLPAPPPEEDKG